MPLSGGAITNRYSFPGVEPELEILLQVLTPLKGGPAGTEELNQRLKARLNPPPAKEQGAWEGQQGERAAAWYGKNLREENAMPLAGQGTRNARPEVQVGDSMIQLTNNYDLQVFNGDEGRVTRVWRDGRALRFTVLFESRSIGTSLQT